MTPHTDTPRPAGDPRPVGPMGPRPGGRPPRRGGRPPFRRDGRPGGDRPQRSDGPRLSRKERDRQRQRRQRRDLPPTPRRENDYYPERPAENVVRVIPLGGVEEVGRNMCAVEMNGDIFVLDAGFQFVSEDTNPGIDYLLPNTRYLEKNQDRVRAVIITHGHLDHIGGIPFLLGRFGNPPIYTQMLTSVMILKRQEEYPDSPDLDIHVVKVGDRLKIGSTFVKFFPVTHSIPDSMGVSLESPMGNVVVSGDLKLDHDDGTPSEREMKTWGALGKEKNILFIADSTNAERDGFSMPEKRVHQTLEDIVKTVKGRLIIGTFASQFERMIHIIIAAEKLGKKIVTEGRSIRSNLEIAEKTGIFTPKKGTIIPSTDIDRYPADKIIVLSTGAQGEEFAALMRIATKKHKSITLTERDTVVLSSSVIPGNEIAVQKLKDNLYRHGVSLIHYRTSDVHSTGHGNTGELVWMNKQVGAKFFMPAYGYHSMLRCHAKAVEQSGVPRENIIIPDNGTVIDFIDGDKLLVHKEKVPAAPLLVDGFSIGDMQEVVIRDRQMLAQDGIVVVIATVLLKTGKLKKSPDIISRGFVYIRESQELFQQARILVKKNLEDGARGMNPVDLEYLKNDLTKTLEGFLFQKTNKNPIVIPVLIGI